MNKQVKVVKINEALTTICDKNKPKKYKNEFKSKKSKYDQILESTQRIKNLIKNKYKTRKSNDDEIKNSEKNQDDVFRNQFKKQVKKKTYIKTQKRSKIKQKTLDNNVIDQILTELKLSHQKHNKTNKEDLLHIFRNILNTNNINLTNKFIKKINKKQTNIILYFLGIVNLNSRAPLPLLKNILYNFLTSDIIVINCNKL
jgi:hypothetical protein